MKGLPFWKGLEFFKPPMEHILQGYSRRGGVGVFPTILEFQDCKNSRIVACVQ